MIPKSPKRQGVAFGITIDEDGKYQLTRMKLNGKSAHSSEILRDDLTRYDIRHQFNKAIAEFFHDFETSKLY